MIERPLADHAIIVTGASSGIGAELARQAAAQGAWLVLTARRPHELDVVAQGCIAAGGRAVLVAGDITDPQHCQHVVERGMEAFGKIDVLVNNAGIGGHFAVRETTDLSVFERIMRVNYLGTVYMTCAALPHLIAARGRVVGMSSLTGLTGVPLRAAYAASKHAMHGFLDSLRIELADTGVAVTVICPGFVQTPIRSHALGPDGEPLGRSHVREGEVMAVDECAEIALRGIIARRRQVVMTLRGQVGALIRPFAPGVIDRVAARAVREGK